MTRRDIEDFDYRGASLDELVIFTAQLNVVVGGYEALSLEMPEWLAQRVGEAKAELEGRLK